MYPITLHVAHPLLPHAKLSPSQSTENDSATDFVRVGTSTDRPTYQDVDAMLESKGIALKYARDVGLAPKF
jgi:hypothetical protein